MKIFSSLAALLISLPFSTYAEAMSPEEITALIDQKVSSKNPYQELLNNPDPARSLAAMEIMLESKDEDLVGLALEYGILSPNPTVQRIAFEKYLQSKPVLSLRIDGTQVESNQFSDIIRSYWSGTLDSDMIGYWKIPVGNYDDGKKCFLVENSRYPDECFITVNSEGIFLTPTVSFNRGRHYSLNARATISNDGKLAGSAKIVSIDEYVPFYIRLIE